MKIAVLSGDGVGPEVMEQTLRILSTISSKFALKFEIHEGLVGGAAFEKYQQHLPEVTLDLCRNSQAILFGSVGGPITEAHLPKWKNCEVNALLGIRKAFGFFANLRPCDVYPELSHCCPLKDSIVKEGASILIVRELLGDLYFGEKITSKDAQGRFASDLCLYNEDQIANIARVAFKAALTRKKQVVSVDKANVLDSSKLWREVVNEVSREFSDIKLEHMLVDNCAMQLVRNPTQFDVILTTNMFGDILSDIGSVLPGSLGMTPSASLNLSGFGLYEPSGGSAPDIAGKGIANPTAQILSLAMLLRLSFGLEKEAVAIEEGLKKALCEGARTADIVESGEKSLSTKDFTTEVIAAIEELI